MAAVATNEKRTSMRGLGEIALRVINLDAMEKFYEEVIGLPLSVLSWTREMNMKRILLGRVDRKPRLFQEDSRDSG